MMRGAAISLACLLATPLVAEGEAFLGVRCSPDETISVEVYGVGFNESTVCEFVDAPFYGDGTMEMTLNCATIVVTDYDTDPVTTLRMDETTVEVLLNRVSEIDLDVFIDGDLIGRFGACG